MIELLTSILPFALAIYMVMIVWLTYGWMSLGRFRPNHKAPHTKVAVLIPARNEEKNIRQCLSCLTRQRYPSELLEIILINDGSTDNTLVIAEELKSLHATIQIINLPDEYTTLARKKKALSTAIETTKATLIITTDADCRMNERWVETIVNYYETYQVQLIAGPVRMTGGRNLLSQMVCLDFMSLEAAGAASFTLNRPIMCNGANLAFERHLATPIEAYTKSGQFASGDDVFLAHYIRYQRKGKIGFIKHEDAIVETAAPPTLQAFLSQRLRWASKSSGYRDLPTILTASTVFFMNLLLLTCLTAGLFEHELLRLGLLLLMIKFFTDLPVLVGFAYFSGQTRLLLYTIPVEFINSFLLPIIAVAGNLVNVEWKGRKVR